MDAAERARQDRRRWVRFVLGGISAAWVVGGAFGAVIGGLGIALGYATAGEVEAE